VTKVQADEATHEQVRRVVKEAAKKYGLFGDGFAAEVAMGVEEVFGPHQVEYDGQTGIRWTRLEPEADGSHLFVGLIF